MTTTSHDNVTDHHVWELDERQVRWHGGRQVNLYRLDPATERFTEVDVASEASWWGGMAPLLTEVDAFAREILTDDERWEYL